MDNVKIKDLRVAVVPVSETDIDQRSTVDEILNCEETILYPLTDFFQDLNDEEIFSDNIFTFLIDVENKIDYTGCNINGIHQEDNPND